MSTAMIRASGRMKISLRMAYSKVCPTLPQKAASWNMRSKLRIPLK